jgi:hypothetical protein
MSAQVDSQRVMPTPSLFVTLVAWIFIGLSSCATLISILQNIMLSFAFSSGGGFPIEDAQRNAPPAIAFMMGHLRFYFIAFLIVSVATLLCSVGLLRRRPWARIAFIGILGLGIVWNIGGIVLQHWVVGSMLDMKASVPTPPDFDEAMRAMTIAIRVVSAFFAVAVSGLFGWIIARLLSPRFAAEFT